MTELTQHAMLLLRYEGVDYPICGYFMPQAVLNRAEISPAFLISHDAAEGLRLQTEIQSKLKHIYDTVILPSDIKTIAQLKHPEPPALGKVAKSWGDMNNAEKIAAWNAVFEKDKLKPAKPSILDITRMFG